MISVLWCFNTELLGITAFVFFFPCVFPEILIFPVTFIFEQVIIDANRIMTCSRQYTAWGKWPFIGHILFQHKHSEDSYEQWEHFALLRRLLFVSFEVFVIIKAWMNISVNCKQLTTAFYQRTFLLNASLKKLRYDINILVCLCVK